MLQVAKLFFNGTISKQVNMPLQQGWQSYWAEVLMFLGLLIYIANMVYGKGRNSRLAQDWFSANRRVLEEQFGNMLFLFHISM